MKVGTHDARFVYEVTPDDELWLLRAVEAEGAPRADVAATLVNKFVWRRARTPFRGTLAEHVRQYSQPVNPRWFPEGDKYAESVARLSEADKQIALARAQHRVQVHASRTTFSAPTRKAVRLALTSPPRLPEATDFAAPWVERKPPWEALTPAEPGKNRLWVNPEAKGWKGYAIVSLAPVAIGISWGLIALGVALLVWVGRDS